MEKVTKCHSIRSLFTENERGPSYVVVLAYKWDVDLCEKTLNSERQSENYTLSMTTFWRQSVTQNNIVNRLDGDE